MRRSPDPAHQASAWSGSVTRNVLPMPSWLSSAILPSWRRMILRIARGEIALRVRKRGANNKVSDGGV